MIDTLIAYLDRRSERRLKLQLARLRYRRTHRIDARGWVGISVYTMSIIMLVMWGTLSQLRADEFFKTMMTLVIGTGFVNGVVSWAYSATKGGGDLAERNADLVQKQAESQPPIAPTPEPQK